MKTIETLTELDENCAWLIKQGIWRIYSIKHESAAYVMATSSSYCCSPGKQNFYFLSSTGRLVEEPIQVDSWSDIEVIESIMIK